MRPPVDRSLVSVREDGSIGLRDDTTWSDDDLLAFERWLLTACPHTDFIYAQEQIGNWSAVSFFRHTLRGVEGNPFEATIEALPYGNGGSVSPGVARQVLAELAELDERAVLPELVALVRGPNCSTVAEAVLGDRFDFFLGGSSGYDLGLDIDGHVSVRSSASKETVFRSVEFTATVMPGRSPEERRVRFLDRAGQLEVSAGADLASCLFDGDAVGERSVDFRVSRRPIVVADFHGLPERLSSALRASIEIGKPLAWC